MEEVKSTTALTDHSTTVPVADFHLLIGWTLTVALINGDVSMNCWQQYMSTSLRRERSRAWSDQYYRGNSSPAYYSERYDGEREGKGLRCGKIITVRKPGWACCKCSTVDVQVTVIWLILWKWWNMTRYCTASDKPERICICAIGIRGEILPA